MTRRFSDNIRRLRRPENEPDAPGRRWKTNWPAELCSAAGRVSCVVVDISSWGARLRVDPIPAERERVWLNIECIGTIAADVVWRRDGIAGVQFLEQQAWIHRLHAQQLDPAAWSPATNNQPA